MSIASAFSIASIAVVATVLSAGPLSAQPVYEPPKGLQSGRADDFNRYRPATSQSVVIARIRAARCEDLARQVVMQPVANMGPDTVFAGMHRLYWSADAFAALRVAVQPCQGDKLALTIDLVQERFASIAQSLAEAAAAAEAERKAQEVAQAKEREAASAKLKEETLRKVAEAAAKENAKLDASEAKEEAEFLARNAAIREASRREIEKQNENIPPELPKLVRQFTLYQFAEYCSRNGVGVTSDQLKAVENYLKSSNKDIAQATKDDAWTRATIGTRIEAPKLTRQGCAEMPGLLATEFPVLSSPGLQRSPF